MEKKITKIKKEKEQEDKDLCMEFLSFEFYDFKLKALAKEIKMQQYRPRLRINNF